MEIVKIGGAVSELSRFSRTRASGREEPSRSQSRSECSDRLGTYFPGSFEFIAGYLSLDVCKTLSVSASGDVGLRPEFFNKNFQSSSSNDEKNFLWQ